MTTLPIDDKKLVEICREHNVAQLGLFGSTVRGEAGENSDLDLLVEFSKPTSQLGLIGLEQRLEYALGRKIDLLTKAALSPYLRDHILQELRVIYEAS